MVPCQVERCWLSTGLKGMAFEYKIGQICFEIIYEYCLLADVFLTDRLLPTAGAEDPWAEVSEAALFILLGLVVGGIHKARQIDPANINLKVPVTLQRE